MTKYVLTICMVLMAFFTTQPVYASFDDQFVCGAIGDGNYTVTISSKDSSRAMAVYALGGDQASGDTQATGVPLRAAATGSGFRYVGEGLEFHGKGNRATLTDTRANESVNCVFHGEQAREDNTSTTTGQTKEWPVINARGFSLGGKVRSGPGLNHQQIGSIRGKTPITIVQNTGVMMNGYYWFKIHERNGDSGYQWGGIICSDALHIIGIYERCE